MIGFPTLYQSFTSFLIGLLRPTSIYDNSLGFCFLLSDVSLCSVSNEKPNYFMLSLHYTLDFSGYIEVLYRSKTVRLYQLHQEILIHKRRPRLDPRVLVFLRYLICWHHPGNKMEWTQGNKDLWSKSRLCHIYRTFLT